MSKLVFCVIVRMPDELRRLQLHQQCDLVHSMRHRLPGQHHRPVRGYAQPLLPCYYLLRDPFLVLSVIRCIHGFKYKVKGKVKPLNGQTCLPYKVGGRVYKVLATWYFIATAFIRTDGQSSPSPLYLYRIKEFSLLIQS